MFVCSRAQSLPRNLSIGQNCGSHSPIPRRHPLRNGSLPRDTERHPSQFRPRFSSAGLARKFRLDNASMHRRAELDYVDYRHLNGAFVENGHVPSELVDAEHAPEHAELDQDVEELEAATPKNGVWQRVTAARSFFSKLKNDKDFGKRGEGLVIVTVLLTTIALLPPLNVHGCIYACGYAAIAYGVVSTIAGIVALGSSFSPLPVPQENAVFITRGIFRFVRHPFYSGLLLICLGLGIVTGNEFRLLMTGVLYWILDQTIKGEERDLEAAYPEYVSYKSTVAKLIPYTY